MSTPAAAAAASPATTGAGGASTSPSTASASLASPPPVLGPRVRLATYNVENLFSRFQFRANAPATLLNGFTINDLAFSTLDEESKVLTALSIREINADVLCLQEVESLSCLDRFREKFLKGMHYHYSVMIESHDPRFINVAVLSKYEITRIRSHKDEMADMPPVNRQQQVQDQERRDAAANAAAANAAAAAASRSSSSNNSRRYLCQYSLGDRYQAFLRHRPAQPWMADPTVSALLPDPLVGAAGASAASADSTLGVPGGDGAPSHGPRAMPRSPRVPRSPRASTEATMSSSSSSSNNSDPIIHITFNNNNNNNNNSSSNSNNNDYDGTGDMDACSRAPSFSDQDIYLFSRDCLEVDVQVDDCTLTLYVNHFKAMNTDRSGTYAKRYRQAERVAEIVDDKWYAKQYRGNFVICGDLNDWPSDDSSLMPLLGHPGLHNVVEQRLPAHEQWTHYHPATDAYHQLDYLFLSDGLARANPHATPVVYRRGCPLRAARNVEPRLPGVGYNRPKASDHCPVWIDVHLVRKWA